MLAPPDFDVRMIDAAHSRPQCYAGATLEQAMSLIAWIIIGLLAGWLAAKITDSPRGLLRNLAVGLIGAVPGGFLFTQLGLQVMPDFGAAC
jgi:uncharacterized membrane protein YeaQ/YmgE (transglycosylase-associated protein family)